MMPLPGKTVNQESGWSEESGGVRLLLLPVVPAPMFQSGAAEGDFPCSTAYCIGNIKVMIRKKTACHFPLDIVFAPAPHDLPAAELWQ